MSEKRKLLISLIYASITLAYDSKLKKETTKKIVWHMLAGDELSLEKAKFKYRDELVNVMKHVNELEVELTKEKRIIASNNFVEEVYSFIDYLKDYNDKSKSIVVRQKIKLDYLIKEALCEVTKKYIIDEELGKKYKRAYIEYKKDITKYNEYNLMFIDAVTIDENDKEMISDVKEQRKLEMVKVFKKYKNIFKLTKDSFKSVFEEDLVKA